MYKPTYGDPLVAFRAPQKMIEGLKNAAAAGGLSLSQYMRQLCARELKARQTGGTAGGSAPVTKVPRSRYGA